MGSLSLLAALPLMLFATAASADPIITPAIISIGSTVGVTISSTVASIISYALITAATVGLSYALSSDGEDKGKTNAGQLITKQSEPPRVGGYGRAKLGGALMWMETNGPTLYQGIIHAEGPIDAYEEWWLNDTNSGIAAETLGGPNTATPWGNAITIESHLGEVGQAASSMLMTGFPGSWTAGHTLSGLAYSVIKFALPAKPEKNFSKVYPGGAPQLRVVVRLAKVYDPRTGLTEWSENPGLCIRDYLISSRGLGIPESRINNASFSAFADVCDEEVPLADGGTEVRYRLGGVHALTEEPRDVLRRMLATCDGELYSLPDGTVGIRGGRWVDPTITITDEMVTGYEYQQGSDKLSAFNQLKISFTSPEADYQVIEAEAWDDLDAQATQGVLTEDLSLLMVPSPSQARRLAKIVMAKGNPRHRLTLSTNLAGLNVLGESVVHLTLSELLIDEPFAVTKFEMAGDLTRCTMTLISLDETAYEWDAATEEGEAPHFAFSEAIEVTPPDPTGITVTELRQDISGGTEIVRARVTVTGPVDANAAYWSLVGRIRIEGEVSDDAWVEMVSDGDWAVISPGLTDGVVYEIQVAFAGLGELGAWSTSQAFWSGTLPARITESGAIRIIESGDYRVLESA